MIEQAPSFTHGAVVGSTNVGTASVKWLGLNTKSTETDAFGAYSAAGLPAGNYTSVISLAGCDLSVAQFNALAGATITKNFELEC